MSLESYKASPSFRKAAEGMEALATANYEDSRFKKVPAPGQWPETYGRCWRVVATRGNGEADLAKRPDELGMWDRNEKFKVEEAMWGRFPCTANKYLPHLMEKHNVVPPWLRAPEVMFEFEKRWPYDCVRYTDAAVGNHPKIRSQKRPRASDVLVSQEDLILAECWVDRDVPVEEIKRIYIGNNATPGTVAAAEELAEKWDVPISRGWPEPEPEMESKLVALTQFLKDRRSKCVPGADRDIPFVDPYAAALAEVYDGIFHRTEPWYPVRPLAVSTALDETLRTRLDNEKYVGTYGESRGNYYN